MSLVTQISDVVTSIGTAIKTTRGTIGTLANLSTSAKSDLVSAINEVEASVSGAGATIDDTGTSTSSVWSSSHTSTEISSATAELVASAPSTLDTLKELADALGDDANYATTTSTALGNRLRFDAAQTLSSTEQTQGQTNLSVYSQTQLGDPTTDFTAVLSSALS